MIHSVIENYEKRQINSLIRDMKLTKSMMGYCMKCKTKRTMMKITKTKMKNGRPANRGTCSKCKTKMFKIGN